SKLTAALRASPGKTFTAEALAGSVGGDPEIAFKILEHLAANGVVTKDARTPWPTSTYRLV
ncbi:MAG TPA: glucose-6-phosphate isomerase, partial [Candidatus Synoicihabitans sp.]|nr:glucose-6-phosphate isomerase [Candidatus Synoicihabitans sp.]